MIGDIKSIKGTLRSHVENFESITDREKIGKRRALALLELYDRSPDDSLMDIQNEHFTASGCVINGDKLLMIYHKKLDLWCFPGGHLEANEHAYECAAREIFEETGVSSVFLAIDSPLAQIDCITAKDHKHIDLTYFFRAISTEIKIEPREVSGAKWMDVVEAKAISRERTYPVFERLKMLERANCSM